MQSTDIPEFFSVGLGRRPAQAAVGAHFESFKPTPSSPNQTRHVAAKPARAEGPVSVTLTIHAEDGASATVYLSPEHAAELENQLTQHRARLGSAP